VRVRVGSALRRAAPALALYAAARLTGMLVLTAWAWHTGKHPRTLLGLSWDARWYRLIVERGYGTIEVESATRIYSDMAFFPLYPGLIRAVQAVLPLGFVNTGLLIAWLASGAAAWGIYAVGERAHGRRTATILVLLWGVLPHAVVQSMAYTEPLMTALAAWALYAAMTDRWLSAGALALLAGLSRANGIAVVAALWAAAVAQVRGRARAPGAERRPGWRLWAGVAAAPLGWLGYVLWVGRQEGDVVRGYFRVQRLWGSEFDFGRDALGQMSRLVRGQDFFAYYMALAIIAVTVVLFVLHALDRPPLPLLVYSTVLLLIALGGARYFTSKPRFLLPAFPLLLPVAVAMARARPRAVAVTVGALAGLSCCYGVYLLTIASAPP
jgi:hypothetical protein